ncbi:hypothetical protein BSL78_25342 [Apostichopus japonicus]|uniref:Uncharacterized protein n=1 Tax=Stichopus japonicus TaxID=307972 RepID=A0A2G8JQ04_STIJA|nr:hypothetical protein BSL78_25342 [Apostichopus japonicus]
MRSINSYDSEIERFRELQLWDLGSMRRLYVIVHYAHFSIPVLSDSTVPPSDQPPEYSAHFQIPFHIRESEPGKTILADTRPPRDTLRPRKHNHIQLHRFRATGPTIGIMFLEFVVVVVEPETLCSDVVTTFSDRPVIFHELGPAPDSLVISIISIFFCLPFGIVATVKAAEARSRNEARDYIGAHHASKTARQFAGEQLDSPSVSSSFTF